MRMNATAQAVDTPAGTRGARALLFGFAYFAGSELGYSLSLGPAVGGTFWPPAGISLAVFLFTSSRDWPLLIGAGVAANFVSDLIHAQMLPASIGFAVANLAEPVLGAFLLRRLLGPRVSFERLAELGVLALVVVCVSAPVASLIGALTAEAWTPNPPGLAQGWRIRPLSGPGHDARRPRTRHTGGRQPFPSPRPAVPSTAMATPTPWTCDHVSPLSAR